MTVCFLVKRFQPIVGGAETQALVLGRWLVTRGVRAVVLTLQFDPSWPREELIEGVTVRRIPARNWLLHLTKEIWSGRNQFSVLQSHGSAAVFNCAGEILARVFGMPVVSRIESGGDVAGLPGRRWGRLRLRLLRSTDALVCISDSIRKELIVAAFPEQKLHFIPNAVASDFFASSPNDRRSDGRFTALYVGRLVACKGLDVLLRAWGTVLQSRPDACLLIVGDGGSEPDSVEADLRSRVSNQKLDGSVCFVGQTPDVKKYLAAADLFVLPSRREGLPVAVLEAMAWGLPIIATRVGGIPDVITDGRNGRLVAPDQPETLAQAILELMADEHLATRLGQAAKESSEKYSVEAIGDRYLDLYAKLKR